MAALCIYYIPKTKPTKLVRCLRLVTPADAHIIALSLFIIYFYLQFQHISPTKNIYHLIL